MNLEEIMLTACLSWFGKTEKDRGFSENEVHLIDKEDIDGYHKRIYLVAFTDYEGYANIYLIRIWGYDTDNLSLSEDYYCTTNKTDELLKHIAPLINKVISVKD